MTFDDYKAFEELRTKSIESFHDGLLLIHGTNRKFVEPMMSTLGDIMQEIENSSNIIGNKSSLLREKNPIVKIDALPKNATVACQGVAGAYQHIATNQLFLQPEITFTEQFEEVCELVESRQVEFGLLPFENSSAGDVANVIEYICKHNCYINTMIQIKIDHCLAAPKGAERSEITTVYSHPQAIAQSSEYIKKHRMKAVQEPNTAIAAKKVAEKGSRFEACICSKLGAEMYGLDVLEESIQNSDENYTRFVCFGKDAYILPNAKYVSIATSFPNQPSSLNRFLTKFSIFGLDLTKIQSMPIGGADFNVRFHLDFKGEINNQEVESLLGHMYDSYRDFQFLGNYRIV